MFQLAEVNLGDHQFAHQILRIKMRSKQIHKTILIDRRNQEAHHQPQQHPFEVKRQDLGLILQLEVIL
jgi:hypothetical protein